MSKINLLPEDLINKIAAGEVIERPASVVKELIENSLDAGASRVEIEIKDYGKELIKISDNGSGMDQEDAKKSVLRHATSKIQNTEDLFAIQTLGFRGEALASIAAVSMLSITTKRKDELGAFNLILEGGKIISEKIIGAEEGTTLEVKNLFFNTPARKKFLKTDAVELRHIMDTVIRYVLIHPEVSFKLVHENNLLLNSPTVNNFRDNFVSIYGTNSAKELLEVSYQKESVKINGFISKPYQARNDRSQQHLFVNQRWIRNDELAKAIYDGYHSLLFVGKHPVFVLNLELNPEKIDVNVHPAKTEIKIEQKEEVCSAVEKAVRETLEKNNLIPIMDLEQERQLVFGTEKKEAKYAFEPGYQTVLEDKPVNFVSDEEVTITELPLGREQYPETSISLKLPPMKILGQILKTFFVAEIEGGALFIDQHVVQERVLYEKFMEQFLGKRVMVQELLQGEILEFSPAEKILVIENLIKLKELGFSLEEFGGNSFILKTVPNLFGRLQPTEMLYTVLEELKSGKNKLEEIQEEIITRMACRASVKAGDSITIPEIQRLLEELARTKLPYTCPHGRAVLIKVPIEELEKKFRRV
ncbi:MAG TPA: DNA mismatch repair endonuclease MutL [Candidatus Nanoarchaeia archaeon]|nr:DNA mismatch repair endonuclease MutL [Candidatus Nanoarchaeia archaeon]